MRILVIVMHSEEGEFEHCLKALREQTLKVDIEVISGLGNVEAHSALYRMIMERTNQYDYFIKCDADMVMKSLTSISEMISMFKEFPDKNHLCFGLHDFFSDSRIIGIHAFRNDVRWDLSTHGTLLLDPNPINAKTKYIKDDFPAPVAYHVLHPTDFQSFYFGLHRTLKVLRKDETKLNLKTSFEHFMLLRLVYQHYLRSFDRRVGLALLGMLKAMDGGLSDLRMKKDNYQSYFQSVQNFSPEEIKNKITSNLSDSFLFWCLMYVQLTGPMRIFRSLMQIFVRKDT